MLIMKNLISWLVVVELVHSLRDLNNYLMLEIQFDYSYSKHRLNSSYQSHLVVDHFELFVS